MHERDPCAHSCVYSAGGRACPCSRTHMHARTHISSVRFDGYRLVPGVARASRIAQRLAVRPVCRPRTSSRTRAAPVRDISRPQTASESRHRPTVAGSADALEPHLVRPAPARMPTSGLLMHRSRRLCGLCKVSIPDRSAAVHRSVSAWGSPRGRSSAAAGAPLRAVQEACATAVGRVAHPTARAGFVSAHARARFSRESSARSLSRARDRGANGWV